jgi:tetratricopeptide (TPR) repeat protein
MFSIKISRTLIAVILSLASIPLVSTSALAEVKVFERSYTYQASEIDSKVTSRAIALEQVKRLLLEEVGTYLVSETDVRNYELTKDKVTVLSAGIVKTEILNEAWDGKTYSIRVRMSVDSAEAAKLLNGSRENSQKSRELEETNRKVDEALAKIKQLQEEQAAGKGAGTRQADYIKAVDELHSNEWINKGTAFMVADNYTGGLDAFSKAVELNPGNVWAHIDKGWALNGLGDYHGALNELNEAEEIDPKNPWIYVNRGTSYNFLGNFRQALLDQQKALSLDTKNAWAYINLGWAYEGLGNLSQAVTELNKAEQLDPQNSFVYSTRAWAYNGLGNSQKAMADFEKSIAVAPSNSWMHWNVALYYALTGVKDKAMVELRTAIRLNGSLKQKAKMEKSLQSLWNDPEFKALVE